jgi:hypothetical protein
VRVLKNVSCSPGATQFAEQLHIFGYKHRPALSTYGVVLNNTHYFWRGSGVRIRVTIFNAVPAACMVMPPDFTIVAVSDAHRQASQ